MKGKHTPRRIAFRRPWPRSRRGLKLWLFSIIISFKGIGYISGKNSGDTDSALQFVTQWQPLSFWGCLILAVCACAMVCSYCHHGRDRYGYMALVGFSSAWAACYAAAPLLLDGPTYAWQGSLSWLLIGFLLLFSAGDPDPLDPQRLA